MQPWLIVSLCPGVLPLSGLQLSLLGIRCFTSSTHPIRFHAFTSISQQPDFPNLWPAPFLTQSDSPPFKKPNRTLPILMIFHNLITHTYSLPQCLSVTRRDKIHHYPQRWLQSFFAHKSISFPPVKLKNCWTKKDGKNSRAIFNSPNPPPPLCGENNICFSLYFQTLLELYTEKNALELASSLPSSPHSKQGCSYSIYWLWKKNTFERGLWYSFLL